MRFLTVLISLFCFNISAFSQGHILPFQNKIDSIFVSCGIDTSNITRVFMSGDIEEQSKFSTQLNNHLGCSDYLIFFPQLITQIPKIEYDLMMMRSLKTFEDYYGFLVDQEIKSALYCVYQNKNNEIVKIEHISIDINIDFGDLISTSYYKQGKLILFLNNHCFRYKRELIVRKFNYDGWKFQSEELITFNSNNFSTETKNYK